MQLARSQMMHDATNLTTIGISMNLQVTKDLFFVAVGFSVLLVDFEKISRILPPSASFFFGLIKQL